MNAQLSSDEPVSVIRISRILNLTIFTLGAMTVILIAFFFSFLDQTIQNFIPVITTGIILILTWIFKIRITDPEAKNYKLIFYQWIALSTIFILVSFIIVVIYPVS